MKLALALIAIATNGFMLYLVAASFVTDRRSNDVRDVAVCGALVTGFVCSMATAIWLAAS